MEIDHFMTVISWNFLLVDFFRSISFALFMIFSPWNFSIWATAPALFWGSFHVNGAVARYAAFRRYAYEQLKQIASNVLEISKNADICFQLNCNSISIFVFDTQLHWDAIWIIGPDNLSEVPGNPAVSDRFTLEFEEGLNEFCVKIVKFEKNSLGHAYTR